ncbi:lysylphosphatidylglycerol synthase domain-containing protein [Bacillus sp. DTU_2020_1000418_1_SI_GHA_SEK_038]|uniref:lysylphosphatidylglycerol synthase domain-containing protein n=1 Tax=Bacillus sp. DTU_2020_1000418_1_SI_GHA_SEK_038 TaxID=3077585 RepID=UPI0028F10D6E|nr:lysylphosphatidylglycerol synthase domain-containing protein [Bacillus sp. DTU_2020_1000418_1_SI_GHA_SEK_038]WNS73513.1 lysylphosphatidylglycerol synthase domain-containing protein [Bacillus sp. DTU_2020_1000418_1_SI_GHA_SEK_038]
MIERWGILSFIKRKTLLTIAKIVFPILILLIISYEAKGLFKDFNWNLIDIYLDRLSLQRIIMIFMIGLIALIPMFFYDVVLFQLFKSRARKIQFIFYSLSANAFSNLVGFGGVAGATLRSIFYRKYAPDTVPVIRIIAKISLFYLTGLSILSWQVAFSDMHVYAEIKFMKFAVWAIAAYTPVLLILFSFRKRFWSLENLQKGFIAELITISIFEWLFVGICIWGIAHLLSVAVPFSIIFPIVIISACAGIISLIPGGIGSFDLVFLIGMETHGIPAELSLLIIMFYRLSYYIFPVLLSTPFVIYQMVGRRNQS